MDEQQLAAFYDYQNLEQEREQLEAEAEALWMEEFWSDEETNVDDGGELLKYYDVNY